MYNIEKIKTGFTGKIGWRQPLDDDPSYTKLTTELTTSSTGLYFNDFHPLITYENIDSVLPDYENLYVQAYSNLTTFSKGSTVYVGTPKKVYISIQDANKDHNPSTNPTWWRPIIEDQLLNFQFSSLFKVFQSVINEKKINQASKGIFEDLRIFEGAGKITNTVIKQGRFVGFEITMKKFETLQARIDYIGLQFSSAQTNLKLYLFHSSREDAVATFTASTSAGNNFEWKAVTNFILSYANYDQVTVGNQTDAGGSFYLGYFEDDLTGQAISKDIDLSKQPCSGCVLEAYNLYAWNQYTKYCWIRPISVEANDLNGIKLWDIEKNTYPRYGNFGLNLSLTIKPDLTDLFIRNSSIFMDAWGKQVAVDVLNLIRCSTRNNAIAETTKQAALFDLKGDSQKPKTGLEYELSQAIKGVTIDISDLGTPALDKYRRSPLKLKAI